MYDQINFAYVDVVLDPDGRSPRPYTVAIKNARGFLRVQHFYRNKRVYLMSRLLDFRFTIISISACLFLLMVASVSSKIFVEVLITSCETEKWREMKLNNSVFLDVWFHMSVLYFIPHNLDSILFAEERANLESKVAVGHGCNLHNLISGVQRRAKAVNPKNIAGRNFGFKNTL